jgi:RNA polymerase primary sigma factor
MESKELLSKPIEDTPLPNRARRWLQVAGIESVGELVRRTEADLMTIRNFADTSLIHVRDYLDKHGLELAPARNARPTADMVKTALADPTFRVMKRERQILIHRHGLDDDKPLTLEETGKIFKLTRERVRQIQKKAEEKVIAHQTFQASAKA